MMRTVRALAAGVLLSGAAGLGAAPSGAATTSRWVMGYYVGYQRDLMPPAQIEWSRLTHLVVGPVTPRANGTLDTSFDIDAMRGPALARNLARLAAAHHVVPMLMIGGDGSHDAWAAAASAHLAQLVDNLVSVLRAYGYAGLDLDWEPIDPADQPHLSALVDALRHRLPHAVLTMPVGWVTRTFPTVSPFYARIARKLDRIDVMTYGMAGAWDGWRTWHSSALTGAGPATPSAVDVTVRSYRNAGVPAGKLGVGIGFYGSCWAGGVTAPHQRWQPGSRIVADDNIMSWVNIRNRYYRAANYHYDTTAQAPYLGYARPHGPQHCTFVSYENVRSITAKARWARRHGLGSLIVWTINQGHLRTAPAGHRDPLLAAARTAFGT